MFSWKDSLKSHLIKNVRAHGVGKPRRCDVLSVSFALYYCFLMIMKQGIFSTISLTMESESFVWVRELFPARKFILESDQCHQIKFFP